MLHARHRDSFLTAQIRPKSLYQTRERGSPVGLQRRLSRSSGFMTKRCNRVPMEFKLDFRSISLQCPLYYIIRLLLPACLIPSASHNINTTWPAGAQSGFLPSKQAIKPRQLKRLGAASHTQDPGSSPDDPKLESYQKQN